LLSRFGLSQPAAVPALQFAGRTITRTPGAASDAAHVAAVTATVGRRHAAAAETKADPVRIEFDRLHQFQQFFVDDVGLPVDLKNFVRGPGFFQGDTEGTDAAAAQSNKDPDGLLFFVFEIFGHQLGGLLCHFQHGRSNNTAANLGEDDIAGESGMLDDETQKRSQAFSESSTRRAGLKPAPTQSALVFTY